MSSRPSTSSSTSATTSMAPPESITGTAPSPAVVDDPLKDSRLTESETNLLKSCLFRLTEGLPRHELRLMAKEARECESALMKEIRILEKAAGVPPTVLPEDMDVDDGDNGHDGDNDDGNSKGDIQKDGEKDGNGSSSSTTDSKENAASANGNNSNDGNTNDTDAHPKPANTTPKDKDTDKSTRSEEQETPSNSSTPIPWAYDPTSNGPNYLPTADAILATELTPPDRYFTISALMGRLREPLVIPPPPFSALARAREAAASSRPSEPGTKKKSSAKKTTHSGKDAASSASERLAHRRKLLDKQMALLNLETANAIYTRKQPDTTALLALWKRISNHRTAAVFRRAVNAKEVPGYAERILFPIDLSLIRKMITAGMITTFQQLHQRIGLICHNCVKFNGREGYYGVITRDFETYVDDSFLDVMQKLAGRAAAAAAAVGGEAGVKRK